MRALVLIAHGSRRSQGNAEVRALTERLRTAVTGRFDEVSCAFLEFVDPSIPDGIEAAIRRGATEVVVIPYFLAAGSHVGEHIPRFIEERRAAHPQVTIRMTAHLGALDGVVELLARAAAE